MDVSDKKTNTHTNENKQLGKNKRMEPSKPHQNVTDSSSGLGVSGVLRSPR